MSEIPLCSVTISSQLPPDEIESLETSLLRVIARRFV